MKEKPAKNKIIETENGFVQQPMIVTTLREGNTPYFFEKIENKWKVRHRVWHLVQTLNAKKNPKSFNRET